jgi:hypothetical protein
MSQPARAEELRDLIRRIIQLFIGAGLARFGNDNGWFVRVGLGMSARVHRFGNPLYRFDSGDRSGFDSRTMGIFGWQRPTLGQPTIRAANGKTKLLCFCIKNTRNRHSLHHHAMNQTR